MPVLPQISVSQRNVGIASESPGAACICTTERIASEVPDGKVPPVITPMYGEFAARAFAMVPTMRFTSLEAISEISDGLSQKKAIKFGLSKLNRVCSETQFSVRVSGV